MMFGADFAFTWGILTFLGNFIPYIGSFVVCLLPIMQGFFQFDTLWEPLTMGLVLICIHQITGNVIEPRITGKSLGISPLAILFTLAFWGYCWGVVGMFLAVPLTVLVKLIMENIEATKPIAALISSE